MQNASELKLEETGCIKLVRVLPPEQVHWPYIHVHGFLLAGNQIERFIEILNHEILIIITVLLNEMEI